MILPTVQSAVGTIRSSLLGAANSRIASSSLAPLVGKLNTFIVVTPHLIHLAPLAALNPGKGIRPVFVSNGLSSGDISWLESIAPQVPVIPLKASLGGNPDSLLGHGVIIDCLASASHEAFCIQDADCFVSDATFWDHVSLDLEKEFAACAFVRKAKGDMPEFPETFLAVLNAPLLRRYRMKYRISAESSAEAPPRARAVLAEAGYGRGEVLENLKNYYDTLQQYWVVATHEGFSFRRLDGEGKTVHHIGGTSYLHRSFENLSHWDYWPLAVHYLHMRVLEMPGAIRFRKRFAKLFEVHDSAAALLGAYPDFAAGRRRANADAILDSLGAAQLYGR
jgi:hypothetical protein